MIVNHVLILAAGKGTRMGKIGENLPKVIWPVFEKSLLELQVAYAKQLAPKAKIYINLFNYSKEINAHIKKNPLSFENVVVIVEESVLDIGGAIHNLAGTLDYLGNLLVLNSDQFLYCEIEAVERALKRLETLDSLLFTYSVNSRDGYNALKMENNEFAGVILNQDLDDNIEIVTYTGMSLIRLEKMGSAQGESLFFETVANYKTNKIGLENITNFEYWDFGTIPRYHNSMTSLLNKIETSFGKFLIAQKAIDPDKINGGFYNSKSGLKYDDFEIIDKEIFFRDIVERV